MRSWRRNGTRCWLIACRWPVSCPQVVAVVPQQHRPERDRRRAESGDDHAGSEQQRPPPRRPPARVAGQPAHRPAERNGRLGRRRRLDDPGEPPGAGPHEQCGRRDDHCGRIAQRSGRAGHVRRGRVEQRRLRLDPDGVDIPGEFGDDRGGVGPVGPDQDGRTPQRRRRADGVDIGQSNGRHLDEAHPERGQGANGVDGHAGRHDRAEPGGHRDAADRSGQVRRWVAVAERPRDDLPAAGQASDGGQHPQRRPL